MIPHVLRQTWSETGGKLVRTCDEPNRLCINLISLLKTKAKISKTLALFSGALQPS